MSQPLTTALCFAMSTKACLSLFPFRRNENKIIFFLNFLIERKSSEENRDRNVIKTKKRKRREIGRREEPTKKGENPIQP